jgi:hypothetical protein
MSFADYRRLVRPKLVYIATTPAVSQDIRSIEASRI